MPVVRLSQKGQVLIPKTLRRKLSLEPGSKIHLAEEGNRLVITPVPADPIGTATGYLKGDFSLTNDLLRDHRDERRRERETRPR